MTWHFDHIKRILDFEDSCPDLNRWSIQETDTGNVPALGRILDQTKDYVVALRNALIGVSAGDRLGFEGR